MLLQQAVKDQDNELSNVNDQCNLSETLVVMARRLEIVVIRVVQELFLHSVNIINPSTVYSSCLHTNDRLEYDFRSRLG